MKIFKLTVTVTPLLELLLELNTDWLSSSPPEQDTPEHFILQSLISVLNGQVLPEDDGVGADASDTGEGDDPKEYD